ncbi:MAG: 2-phosphosulfolactate phosphatase [Verrucomicrobiia bacterium]|jgi:2-phosphosulfolactate phosphatase
MDVNVILTPAEIDILLKKSAMLDETGSVVSVVFDVLRATSAIVVALSNGAKKVIPAETIEEAIALKNRYRQALLAGERNGLKIPASMAGGIEFDFGNSPREFTREKVENKIIITTTTNGTRAIKAAMQNSSTCLTSSFLNLTATAQFIKRQNPSRLIMFCSGTREEPALEDILAAGCLIEKVNDCGAVFSDSAIIARDFYLFHKNNLSGIIMYSANARRLRNIPELAADVDFCLQIDLFNIAVIAKEGELFINSGE